MKHRHYRIRKVRLSKVTLCGQQVILRKAAKRRGLHIKAVPSLAKTPYRAMNPRAARELNIRWPKHTVGFDPKVKMPKSERLMDERHEVIEFDRMGQGHHYKAAHRYANRKQRDVRAVK